MIFAMDVHYGTDGALAAGVAFDNWTDAAPAATHTARIAKVAPYAPGAFYLRELPCLLALLDTLPCRPDVLLIDGFVDLGAEARPGLGAHLHAALGGGVPVVGVAKSPFRGTPADRELCRGQSRNPLYVSAIGLSLDRAKAHVAAMHGPYRIPTLLSAVDRLCRNGDGPKPLRTPPRR